MLLRLNGEPGLRLLDWRNLQTDETRPLLMRVGLLIRSWTDKLSAGPGDSSLLKGLSTHADCAPCRIGKSLSLSVRRCHFDELLFQVGHI